MAGLVGHNVITATGERIGVGDQIATRRNDRETDVATRETWTVLDCANGALVVQGEARRTGSPSTQDPATPHRRARLSSCRHS